MGYNQTVKIDLHVHSNASPDAASTPAQILARMDRLGLDMIALTDHNTIAGALELLALAPERVLVGQEISTASGELLAYWIREPVPPGRSLAETIAHIHDQGGLVGVPHPFDPLRGGGLTGGREQRRRLLALLEHVDAIETLNARCVWPGCNRRAARLAQARGLPGTAGSDAHIPLEIGSAYVEMDPFSDRDTFLQNLARGRIVVRRSPYFTQPLSMWARLINRLRGKRR